MHRRTLLLLSQVVNKRWADERLTPAEQHECHVAAIGIVALRRLFKEGDWADS
jgi:hypothetical protein